MRRLILSIGITLGLFVFLSGCTNPNLATSDRTSVSYAADVDATMDAIEKVIPQMRWAIDRVDDSIQGRVYMNGSTLGSSSPRSAGGAGRSYTFQIGVITEGSNTTRVQLTVESQDYGSSAPREVRRQFFNYMADQGILETVASE